MVLWPFPWNASVVRWVAQSKITSIYTLYQPAHSSTRCCPAQSDPARSRPFR
ncbi:hypothetical protein K523DRAFT_119736 [Schizophyllum commune Tattone D]|nr:hypothetical protein K523DRAFT_119736 [Schizophyllum commune Tattone D]